MTSTESQPFQSVFSIVHDIVILGGGYASFAAAVALHKQGKKVLLVDRQAAIVCESGWAFSHSVGSSKSELWNKWLSDLTSRNAAGDGFIDGAMAEVLATHWIKSSSLPVLYYAAPMGVEREGNLIEAITVGTKSGLRRIASRQWIDATATGELRALLDPHTTAPVPLSRTISLFFRNTQWPARDQVRIPCEQLPGAELIWQPTKWSNERALQITLPGKFSRPFAAWVPAMKALRAYRPDEMKTTVLSHGSVIPLDVYATLDSKPISDAANVLIINAGEKTIAARFERGVNAAESIRSIPSAKTSASILEHPVELNQQIASEETDVVVAGAGTGGALASIAAARQGARVLTVDPLPFGGGIGAGGGIHWYYFGVKGGLQDELDERARQIMPLFGSSSQVHGFHPDSKKVVIDEMFAEAGVRWMPGTMLIDVQRDNGRVKLGLIATPEGPRHIEATAWIDSTGDGDLAARAGARYTLGRSVDGQLHAYSQSSGRVVIKDDVSAMKVVNYDAGYVDSTDSEDMTRARLLGIEHYLSKQWPDDVRPTYIAPAIGLRQSRHIETDYVVTLADLIERRTFPDTVGQTGAHYDNHATDYEFESDEAVFWVWVCRQWRSGRTGCEFPYRMLLPRGLDNVWIACRAAGVSGDAHHSFRMQRDIQRLGEIAGIAAALSLPKNGETRKVPYEPLRRKLEASGAIELRQTPEDSFGPMEEVSTLLKGKNEPASSDKLAGWIEEMKTAPAGLALWHLYRHPELSRDAVTKLLADPDENVSWRAAAILAMWRDAQAEPRLIKAIERREYGFETAPEKDRPEKNNRLAPHWMVAISLLRRCGTAACLKQLHELARDPNLVMNARTAIALTCTELSSRLKLSPQDKNVVVEILRKLLSTSPPNTTGNPQKNIVVPGGQRAHEATPGMSAVVIEDFSWQYHLAVAKAEQAVGQPMHPQAKVFIMDPRAIVRRAFSQITQNY